MINKALATLFFLFLPTINAIIPPNSEEERIYQQKLQEKYKQIEQEIDKANARFPVLREEVIDARIRVKNLQEIRRDCLCPESFTLFQTVFYRQWVTKCDSLNSQIITAQKKVDILEKEEKEINGILDAAAW